MPTPRSADTLHHELLPSSHGTRCTVQGSWCPAGLPGTSSLVQLSVINFWSDLMKFGTTQRACNKIAGAKSNQIGGDCIFKKLQIRGLLRACHEALSKSHERLNLSGCVPAEVVHNCALSSVLLNGLSVLFSIACLALGLSRDTNCPSETPSEMSLYCKRAYSAVHHAQLQAGFLLAPASEMSSLNHQNFRDNLVQLLPSQD